ncbi:hypothetical protein Tco_0569935 [Tanacetum coccineum]
MKNEGTAQGTVRKYCFYSKVLLIMLKVLLVVKVPLLCSKVLLVSSEKLVYTASFVRYRTERNFWFSDVKTISYKVIMKKIEYCLFDVVVEFHREMITSQLQGKLRLYDEVRARTLFVLSSSNRGRLLGIIDLMRQKNKRMKQEGLNRQIGKLQDVGGVRLDDERIDSLRLENLKVRAMLDIKRDRVNSLRLHMSLSQEEFRQVRRDRDDTRGRLRRLESYVERRLGFRP